MQVRALSEERAGRRRPLRRESLLDLVGNTPLIRLNHVTRDLPSGVEVWAKLETMNPGGSVKDRPARQILLEAVESGKLQGRRLLDATAGNTGVAYAMFGASLGLPITLVMPSDVSETYRTLVRAFGAEVIFSPANTGIEGCIELARETLAANPGEFHFVNQHANDANRRAHELGTAPEIWKQTEGRVTHFVSSAATAGTLLGTARGLHHHNPAIRIIGAQPASKMHGLRGLRQLESDDAREIDEKIDCPPDEVKEMARRLAHEEGIAAGNGAGANVWASLRIAAKLTSGVVVTIISGHADHEVGT